MTHDRSTAGPHGNSTHHPSVAPFELRCSLTATLSEATARSLVDAHATQRPVTFQEATWIVAELWRRVEGGQPALGVELRDLHNPDARLMNVWQVDAGLDA